MSTSALTLQHAHAVKRGRELEYFTLAWNSLEGLIAWWDDPGFGKEGIDALRNETCACH